MNRRKFIKIGALLTSAMGISARQTLSAATAAAPRCRITVVRRQCFPDIQGRYLADPDEGPCTLFKEGDTFEAGSCAPEGFCPKAWECIRAHVESVLDPSTPLCCGAAEADGAVIACCNDGTRPVVFRIERI